MRQIECYRRGCRNQSIYKINTTPVMYLCKQCLEKLIEGQSASFLPRAIGPSEVKQEDGYGETK